MRGILLFWVWKTQGCRLGTALADAHAEVHPHPSASTALQPAASVGVVKTEVQPESEPVVDSSRGSGLSIAVDPQFPPLVPWNDIAAFGLFCLFLVQSPKTIFNLDTHDAL